LISVLTKGSVVRVALRALGELGDPQAVPAIIPCLEDGDEYVRSDAASALGKLRDARAVEPLVAALKKQTWPKGQMGSWSAYERIAEALGAIGDPSARDVLEDVFTRHRSDERAVGLRAAAAKALVGVAGREARERLSALANDRLERSLVRKAAEEALKEIDALPEPAPPEPARAAEPATLAATVLATDDGLDAILDPPVGRDVTAEQEQAYVRNVRVMQEGGSPVGFWIREPSNAETKLRIFLALSLEQSPASYRVAQNQTTDRGGYFLMFDKARAPSETEDQYRAAMESNRSLAKGNLAAQRGDFQEALRHFQQAAKGQPYSPEAWNNQAVALASLNRNEDAIRCCDRVIELKPDYADAWDIKGRCLGRLGRYREAIPVIEHYTEVAPDDSVHGPRVRQAKRALQGLRSRS
jgi:tetratricopeptide (TPR) repeat protein